MTALTLDELAIVGTSHNTANVAVRERLSITPDQVPAFLQDLRDREMAREGLVLSTCNRTELYCVSPRPDLVVNEMAMRDGRELPDAHELFYLRRGREAIRHAFTVASGLDSMILGEPEILGQMKRALAAAREGSFAGSALTRLFESGFRVAKQVRTGTAIGREAVSAPAICARLATRVFGEPSACNVLCVGAGAIIEAALGHFSGLKPARLQVANRTLHHARTLAAGCGATTLPYEDMTQELHHFDIVVTATGSVLPVIGKGALERALRARRRRPMAVFDLAVPRDVEPEAGELEDLFLYTIDDIGKIAGDNLGKRREAATQAQGMIDTAIEELAGWFAGRDAATVARELRTRVDRLRDEETRRAVAALGKGASPDAAITELARRLAKRLAHDPLRTLRESHANRDLVDELGNWYHARTDNGSDHRPS